MSEEQDIETQSEQLVRSGQGVSIVLRPDIEYDFTPLNRQPIENVTVRSFINGRGMYQHKTGENVVQIKMPEDRNVLIITQRAPGTLLLVAKFWYVDFITMVVEGERLRRGLPQCLIIGEN